MTTREDLLATLAPVLDVVRGLDLRKPDDAARTLTQQFPLDGPVLTKARAQFRAGVVDGSLCERENAGVKFSRMVKDSGGWSVDAVHMSGTAVGHTHPNGEVDLAFVVDGAPSFDGHPPGWTVYPPGSWHVPTVKEGVMDIVYFLPKGAIVFDAK